MKKKLLYIYVIIISLISVYGVYNAPSSKNDIAQMELEFEENQQLINVQELNMSEGSDTDTASNTITVSDITAEKNQSPIPESISADEAISIINNYIHDYTSNSYTIIGDSVVLGAASKIIERIPNCYVDAAKSRQVQSLKKLIPKMEEEHHLGNVVIIALGINGYFTEETGQELIDSIGKDKTIFWINTYGRYKKDCSNINTVIQHIVDNNSNVSLIDWYDYGRLHPEFFYSDGIHLVDKGKVCYADLILRAIKNT